MEFLPYEGLIKFAIQTEKLRELEKASHQLDEAYLRWEQVRHNGVSLDSNSNGSRISYKTGFEGYFVGTSPTQEQLKIQLLKVGEEAWKSIRNLHKGNFRKIHELKKTIENDKFFTVACVAEWSSILGSQIARLRMNLLNNHHGQIFQFNTRQAVALLPKIEYTLEGDALVEQKYKLPKVDGKSSILTFETMTAEQKLYWTTVLNLGKFGHPLVRAALGVLYR